MCNNGYVCFAMVWEPLAYSRSCFMSRFMTFGNALYVVQRYVSCFPITFIQVYSSFVLMDRPMENLTVPHQGCVVSRMILCISRYFRFLKTVLFRCCSVSPLRSPLSIFFSPLSFQNIFNPYTSVFDNARDCEFAVLRTRDENPWRTTTKRRSGRVNRIKQINTDDSGRWEHRRHVWSGAHGVSKSVDRLVVVVPNGSRRTRTCKSDGIVISVTRRRPAPPAPMPIVSRSPRSGGSDDSAWS